MSLPAPVSTTVLRRGALTANSVLPPPSATETSSCAVYEMPAPRPRPAMVDEVSVPSLPVELESPVSSR